MALNCSQQRHPHFIFHEALRSNDDDLSERSNQCNLFAQSSPKAMLLSPQQENVFFLKHRNDFMFLFKIHHWLSINLRIKSKTLTVGFHNLTFSNGPHFPSPATLLLDVPWTVQTHHGIHSSLCPQYVFPDVPGLLSLMTSRCCSNITFSEQHFHPHHYKIAPTTLWSLITTWYLCLIMVCFPPSPKVRYKFNENEDLIFIISCCAPRKC